MAYKNRIKNVRHLQHSRSPAPAPDPDPTAAAAAATTAAVRLLPRQRSTISSASSSRCPNSTIIPPVRTTTPTTTIQRKWLSTMSAVAVAAATRRAAATATRRFVSSSSPKLLSALTTHVDDDDDQGQGQQQQRLQQIQHALTDQIRKNIDQVLTSLDQQQQHQQQQRQHKHLNSYYTNRWKKQYHHEKRRQQQKQQNHHHRRRHSREFHRHDEDISTLWENALIQAGLKLNDNSLLLIDETAASTATAAAVAEKEVEETLLLNSNADYGNHDFMDDDDAATNTGKTSSLSSTEEGLQKEYTHSEDIGSYQPHQHQHQQLRTPIFNLNSVQDGGGNYDDEYRSRYGFGCFIDENDDRYKSFLQTPVEEQPQEEKDDDDRTEEESDELFQSGEDVVKGISVSDTQHDTMDGNTSFGEIYEKHDDISTNNGIVRMMDEKEYNDVIIRAISLLSVLDGETWEKIGHHQHNSHEGLPEVAGAGAEHDDHDQGHDNGDDIESIQTDDETFDYDDDTTRDKLDEARHFLQLKESLEELITNPDHRLPTTTANLALAYLTTLSQDDVHYSDKDLSDEIFATCLQIYARLVDQATDHPDANEKSDNVDNYYNEEDSFGSSYIPDESTFRILLKAYNGRLMAYSEAIKLSKSIILNPRVDHDSDSITSEVLYEGLKACRIKMDLASARMMMDAVVALSENGIGSFRPSLGSVMMMLDMLRVKDCRSEALDFVEKLERRRMISQKAQDKVLLSLCGWPTHSSSGERIDLSSFYADVMSRMETTTREYKRRRCGIHVWAKLIERMEVAAKFDPSLWRSIVRAIKTVSVVYPDNFFNWKLTTIGLEAARLTDDASMAADILRRQDSQVPIPQRALKSGLGICVKASNASACDSIVHTLQTVESDYPAGVLQDLYGMILMCYAKAGEGRKAMDCLQSMLNKGMDPEYVSKLV